MLAGLHGNPATRRARRALRPLLATDAAPPSFLSHVASTPSHPDDAQSRPAADRQVVPRERLVRPGAYVSTEAATSDLTLRVPRAARRSRRSRNCKTLKRADAQSRRREDASLQRLQDVLHHLQRRRALYESVLLDARNRATAHAMDITTSFYALFARGLDRDTRPEQSRHAEAFLRSVMAEDATCKEFVGVDTFLNQYEVTTRCHASMLLELQRVSVLPDDEGCDDRIQIFAQATARLRISRTTLACFFPSVIQDEELTQRLIGKEYVLQYDKVFHVRVTDGRIFQHESRIDFCASLMTMVGDPFLTLRLVQASLMSKDGHWKVDECIEEDRHQLENEVL